MLRRIFWLMVFGGTGVMGAYLCDLPDIKTLQAQNPSTFAFRQLREEQARKAGKSPHSVQQWRPIQFISPYLRQAVLLAEDDRFYQHEGFDLEQIRNAIQTDWQRQKFAYGGSTLTQQLARTLYLTPKKNLLRKMKEAIITWQLERHLTKRRILELYLNVVEWGPGIYGAEAASRHFFNKGADGLTPEEAVALAAILPSPRRWNPLSQKGFMNKRKTILYNRMVAAGHIPVQVSSGSVPLLDVEHLVGQLGPAESVFEEDQPLSDVLHPAAEEARP